MDFENVKKFNNQAGNYETAVKRTCGVSPYMVLTCLPQAAATALFVGSSRLKLTFSWYDFKILAIHLSIP